MPGLRTIRIQLATIGVRGMVSVALRNRLRRPLAVWPVVEGVLMGTQGLEIGGPSAVFTRGGLVPVYPILAGLDNCDFGGDTLWHGSVANGSAYRYDDHQPAGTHFVRDGTDLSGIADGSYGSSSRPTPSSTSRTPYERSRNGRGSSARQVICCWWYPMPRTRSTDGVH